MTATSAASTLGNSWNRQLPDNDERFTPEPMARGARVAPSLATLDFPKGKVLLAVDDAVLALDLQRLLNDAGFRVVGPVATLAEIQRMVPRGNIDCAILDFEVDRRAPLPISDVLAFADIPFVYLVTQAARQVPVWHSLRPAIKKPVTKEALLSAIKKALAKRSQGANDAGWPVGGVVVPWARVYPPL